MSSKLNQWISAARLRTIPLSISGILVGSFATINQKMFDLPIFLLAIFTTISYQVLSNFANDYGDGIKGTDNNRIGPKRAVQSGGISAKEMKKGIFLLSTISFILTFLLVFISFGKDINNLILFIALGLAAIISAIKYTVGENAYGYMGFGDLFVFLFFGLLSVLGSNFLFTSMFNSILIYPACSIGLLSVGVLNLNNMRDVENDEKSEKKTIVVKLGIFKSKLYHCFLIFMSIIFISILHFKLNSSSLMFLGLIVSLIVLLTIHLVLILNITNPEKFDSQLKPLVFSIFFYSIILSLHFIDII